MEKEFDKKFTLLGVANRAIACDEAIYLQNIEITGQKRWEHKGVEKKLKSFFRSYLEEVLEYLQGEVKNVAGKKFPLGERKWCVECAQRIRKELNNKIKKLKGEG